MNIAYQVPVVFIDSVIEDGYAETEEIDAFNEETSKVTEFLKTDDPYRCTYDTCRNTDYSNGIPISLDTEMGNMKKGWFLNDIMIYIIVFISGL